MHAYTCMHVCNRDNVRSDADIVQRLKDSQTADAVYCVCSIVYVCVLSCVSLYYRACDYNVHTCSRHEFCMWIINLTVSVICITLYVGFVLSRLHLCVVYPHKDQHKERTFDDKTLLCARTHPVQVQISAAWPALAVCEHSIPSWLVTSFSLSYRPLSLVCVWVWVWDVFCLDQLLFLCLTFCVFVCVHWV